MVVRKSDYPRTLVASSARSVTSGNSGALDMEGVEAANILLDITTATGTSPTLDVTVETSADSSLGTAATWYTLTTFTQGSGVTNQYLNFNRNLGQSIRLSWTLGGTTPSFTFSAVMDVTAFKGLQV
jgi:hypothetical protein